MTGEHGPSLPVETQNTEQELHYQVDNVLSQEEREAYWQIVESGFVELNASSLLKQDMHKEEFMHDADDPAVLKFKAYSGEDPVALFTVHTDINEISWVNGERLNQMAGGITDENRRLYYVGTLVMNPDNRGIGAGLGMLKYLTSWFGKDDEESGNNTLLFFDHSKTNHALPDLIQRGLDADKRQYEMEPLGSQVWIAERIPLETINPNKKIIDPVAFITDPKLIDSLYSQYCRIHSDSGVAQKPLDKVQFNKLMQDAKVDKYYEEDERGCRLIAVPQDLPDMFSQTYLENNFSNEEKVAYLSLMMVQSDPASQEFVASVIKDLAAENSLGSMSLIYGTDAVSASIKQSLFENNPDFASHHEVVEEQSIWMIRTAENLQKNDNKHLGHNL